MLSCKENNSLVWQTNVDIFFLSQRMKYNFKCSLVQMKQHSNKIHFVCKDFSFNFCTFFVKNRIFKLVKTLSLCQLLSSVFYLRKGAGIHLYFIYIFRVCVSFTLYLFNLKEYIANYEEIIFALFSVKHIKVYIINVSYSRFNKTYSNLNFATMK